MLPRGCQCRPVPDANVGKMLAELEAAALVMRTPVGTPTGRRSRVRGTTPLWPLGASTLERVRHRADTRSCEPLVQPDAPEESRRRHGSEQRQRRHEQHNCIEHRWLLR